MNFMIMNAHAPDRGFLEVEVEVDSSSDGGTGISCTNQLRSNNA